MPPFPIYAEREWLTLANLEGDKTSRCTLSVQPTTRALSPGSRRTKPNHYTLASFNHHYIGIECAAKAAGSQAGLSQ